MLMNDLMKTEFFEVMNENPQGNYKQINAKCMG